MRKILLSVVGLLVIVIAATALACGDDDGDGDTATPAGDAPAPATATPAGLFASECSRASLLPPNPLSRSRKLTFANLPQLAWPQCDPGNPFLFRTACSSAYDRRIDIRLSLNIPLLHLPPRSS